MSENKSYWLITAPKTREDTYNTLKKKLDEDSSVATAFRFPIPELKVGTLDSLMSLSDDLSKIDATIELVTRKIFNQYHDLNEERGKEEASKALEKSADESLTVTTYPPENYITFFQWDEAKYPSNQPLKAISDSIASTVGKMDEELKVKALEYNNLIRTIASEERNISGNLTVRDLGEVIKPEIIVDTEFLQTLFAVIPRPQLKQWDMAYEQLSSSNLGTKDKPELIYHVVPRSSDIIVTEGEFCLIKFIVLKKYADEVKKVAKDQKFLLREYKHDPNRSAKLNKQKLEEHRENSKKTLLKFCKINFSESFQAWAHLKAIRAFVESVLRYGLPSNFQAMLLLPTKNKVKKLRGILHELYGHLGSKGIYSDEKDDDVDKFFPYVFLEMNLDLRNKAF